MKKILSLFKVLVSAALIFVLASFASAALPLYQTPPQVPAPAGAVSPGAAASAGSPETQTIAGDISPEAAELTAAGSSQKSALTVVEPPGKSAGAFKPVSAPGKLSPSDTAAYNKALGILGGLIKPDMTPYEKELAIHDWMTNNITYDSGTSDLFSESGFNSSNFAGDHAFDAYGAIVSQKAVCEGYAKAFKMFMDMIGVECGLVTGKSGGQPHSWNQVKLDGSWYNVDVTYDDPIILFEKLDGTTYTRPHNPQYKYFNAPDSVFSEDHTWDKSKYHECTDTKYYLQLKLDEEQNRMYERISGFQVLSTLADADEVIGGGKFVFIDKKSMPSLDSWNERQDIREFFDTLIKVCAKYGLTIYYIDFAKTDAEYNNTLSNAPKVYLDFRNSTVQNKVNGNRGIIFFFTPESGGTAYCVNDISTIGSTIDLAFRQMNSR